MKDELLAYLAEHYALHTVLEIGDNNELLFSYILDIIKSQDKKLKYIYDIVKMIDKD